MKIKAKFSPFKAIIDGTYSYDIGEDFIEVPKAHYEFINNRWGALIISDEDTQEVTEVVDEQPTQTVQPEVKDAPSEPVAPTEPSDVVAEVITKE